MSSAPVRPGPGRCTGVWKGSARPRTFWTVYLQIVLKLQASAPHFLRSVMTDTSESDAVGYTHLALNIRLATPIKSRTGSPAFAAMPNTKKCNSSMQLTRAADYAVRVMVYLAKIP